MPKPLLILVALMAMLVIPASASAATCADPSINVQVSNSLPTVGETVHYSYNFCWNSAGNRYTVQLLKETPDGTGNYTESPVTALETHPLAGVAGSTSGGGDYQTTTAGRFVVRVLYYRNGSTPYEAKGEIVFRPQEPVRSPPPPVHCADGSTVPNGQSCPPPPPPPPPPPVHCADGSTVPNGQSCPPPPPPPPVETHSQPRAKLRLVKSAHKSVYRAGQTSIWRLVLSNVSNTTAENVQLCDRLPSQVQFVSASRSVSFRGSSACFSVGSLGAHRSFSVTLRLAIAPGTRGRIRNTGVATASNADTVRAAAQIRVSASHSHRRAAPVTG